MKTSLQNSTFIFVVIWPMMLISLHGQNKINQYEYWFDDNHSGKVVTNVVPPESIYNLELLVPATGLSPGMHKFSIRFKDDSLNYSPTLTRFFITTGNSVSPVTQVHTYEYWFDKDYNDRISGTSAGQAGFSLEAAINSQTLSEGLHTCHIRFRDGRGAWSPVKSSFFMKIGNETHITTGLTTLQYWFDAGYEDKTEVALGGTIQDDISQLLDADNLEVGIHVLHCRIKDWTGVWSPTKSQFFIKRGNAQPKPSDVITAYRYWFDQKFQQAVTIDITGNANPIELISPIDMTRIRKGNHTLHIQFMDNQGAWSVPIIKTIEKIPYPIAEFTALNNGICPGDTIFFDNTSVDGDTYYWTFGDGQISTDSLPSHIYQTGGNFTVGLTVTDLSYNLDSTLIKPQYIKAEGKTVYETTDSLLGSLRNVIRCASPNDVIGFESGLDTLIMESPLALDKNLLLKNDNPDPVAIMANFAWPGFAGSTSFITVPHLVDAEFIHLDFVVKNNSSGQSAILNRGNTTLENVVIRGAGSNLIKNEKEVPSNNTTLTIKGTVRVKIE